MNTSQHNTIYLYDVTRLIQRRRSTIPTGIDRIDAQWAYATFERFGNNCLPVMLHGGKAIILDFERNLVQALIRSLVRCWFEAGVPSEHIACRLDRAGLSSNAGFGSKKVEKFFFSRKSSPSWLVQSELPKLLYALKTILPFHQKRNGRALAPFSEIVYVNASHMGVLQKAGELGQLSEGRNIRLAVYIHDLIPIEFPEYVAAGSKERLRGFIEEIGTYEAHYSANSQATASSLIQYLKNLTSGPGPDSVCVLYPGFTTIERPKQSNYIEQPNKQSNFVTIGTIEPRKNHLLLLHIWRQLIEEKFRPMPRLTIIGRRGWGASATYSFLDQCQIVRPYVEEISDADDTAMLKHLSSARALLFPSFAEGFGLPLMEAAELSIPVIASDLPVFRELVETGGTFINPLDAASWKSAIKNLMQLDGTPNAPKLQNGIGNWENQRMLFANYVAKISELERS